MASSSAVPRPGGAYHDEAGHRRSHALAPLRLADVLRGDGAGDAGMDADEAVSSRLQHRRDVAAAAPDKNRCAALATEAMARAFVLLGGALRGEAEEVAVGADDDDAAIAKQLNHGEEEDEQQQQQQRQQEEGEIVILDDDDDDDDAEEDSCEQVRRVQPLDVRAVAHLDKTFPRRLRNGGYRASAFQAAILQHMAAERARVTSGSRSSRGSVGLVVLATGLGKTVVALKDVEAQIAAKPPARRRRHDGGGTTTTTTTTGTTGSGGGVGSGGFRFLFLVHTRHIRDQTHGKFVEHFTSASAAAAAASGSARGDGHAAKRRRKRPDGADDDGDDDDGAFSGPLAAAGGGCGVGRAVDNARLDAEFAAALSSASASSSLPPSVLSFEASEFLNVDDDQSSVTLDSLRHVRFVFCLFQSWARLPAEAEFTHVIIDECHHVLAVTYRSTYERLLASPSLVYMVGMTATLCHRDDPSGSKLKRLFRDAVYVDLPWSEAKELGFFPRTEYVECLPTLAGGSDVHTYSALLGRWREHGSLFRLLRELSVSLDRLQRSTAAAVRRVMTPTHIAEVFESYQRSRVSSGLPAKARTLVFTATASEADEVAAAFSRRGFATGVAHYKLGKRRSAAAVDAFARGSLSALVTVDMLSEGYDVRAIDCVVLARVTDSEIKFVQQMGRGLRVDVEGKVFTVIDLALNLRRRWQRLRSELSDADLSALIDSFWHVDNYVGAFGDSWI